MLYYVYEHWLNGKCFYVGCGSIKNNRAFDLSSRNENWYKYCNNKFEVKIIKEFEDGKEAFDFEKELTLEHISNGSPLVNKGIGRSLYGKANGMYGKGYILKGRKKSKEHIAKIISTIKNNGNLKGDKNPMSGVSVLERLGNDNEKYENWKKSCARSGSQNGRASKVKVTNIENSKIMIFDTCSLASEFTKIPNSSLGLGTRNGNILIRNGFKIERSVS